MQCNVVRSHFDITLLLQYYYIYIKDIKRYDKNVMCLSSNCFKGEMVMRKTDFLIDVYSLQRTIEPIPDSGGCVCVDIICQNLGQWIVG